MTLPRDCLLALPPPPSPSEHVSVRARSVGKVVYLRKSVSNDFRLRAMANGQIGRDFPKLFGVSCSIRYR